MQLISHLFSANLEFAAALLDKINIQVVKISSGAGKRRGDGGDMKEACGAEGHLLSVGVVVLTGQLLLHLRHLHQLPLRHQPGQLPHHRHMFGHSARHLLKLRVVVYKGLRGQYGTVKHLEDSQTSGAGRSGLKTTSLLPLNVRGTPDLHVSDGLQLLLPFGFLFLEILHQVLYVGADLSEIQIQVLKSRKENNFFFCNFIKDAQAGFTHMLFLTNSAAKQRSVNCCRLRNISFNIYLIETGYINAAPVKNT